MSGLAVFGFKMPSLLQFEKDKASEPLIRRNLHTLYFEKVRNRIDIGIWESWHHLYTFIGDPSSRPPPTGSGWLVAQH